MRRHRFIINADLSQPIVSVTQLDLIHQWREVLKLKKGEELIVGDGKGAERVGKIAKIGKHEIEIKISEISNAKHPMLNMMRLVTLYCAMLKRDNFEWVVQKATEVGVTKIVPMITERTIKLGFQRTRLERIINEASEQSGRSTVPELGEPVRFEDAMKIEDEIKVFFDFCEERLNLNDLPSPLSALPQAGGDTATVAIFIGPEGGWSQAEREAAEKAGCLVCSLGPLTFRAETAAIVGSYLACNMKHET